MSTQDDEALVIEQLAAAIGDACLILDEHNTIVATNPVAQALYRRTREELVGLAVHKLCPEEECEILLSEIASMNGHARTFKAIQLRDGGARFVGEFAAKAHALGQSPGIVLTVREAAADENSCGDDLALRNLMLNHFKDGIVCHTLEGELLFANRAALKTWGISGMEAARKLGPFGWVEDEQRPHLAATIAEMRTGGEARFESHGIGHSGDDVHLEVHAVLVKTPGGHFVVSSVRDITERLEAEEMVRYLAYHDTLTGLANRVLLESELAHAISLSDRHGDLVGVVFLDLDSFKPVNDTYGHAVGDHVLREVADRIAGAVRETDTVARPGGDEFVILLPRLNQPSDLEVVAKKIAQEVSRPIVLNHLELVVEASVGLAVHVRGEDAETLLTRADLAMYEARENGLAGWELFSESRGA